VFVEKTDFRERALGDWLARQRYGRRTPVVDVPVSPFTDRDSVHDAFVAVLA
jgi:hypothetical protein